MFCPSCGKQSAPDARFCSACGATATVQPTQPQRVNRIVRPRTPRMIAGICSGVAIHFGWDIALVRILLCVFTILTSGVGVLVYVAAWIIVPEAQWALPANAGMGAAGYPGSYQAQYQGSASQTPPSDPPYSTGSAR